MKIDLEPREIAVVIIALQEVAQVMEHGRKAAERLGVPFPEGCEDTIGQLLALKEKLEWLK